MGNKIPKELRSLLIKRRNAGEKLLSLEAQVNQKLEEFNLTNTPEFETFQNECGCMVFAEPTNYYENSVKYVESQLNKENQNEIRI